MIAVYPDDKWKVIALYSRGIDQYSEHQDCIYIEEDDHRELIAEAKKIEIFGGKPVAPSYELSKGWVCSRIARETIEDGKRTFSDYDNMPCVMDAYRDISNFPTMEEFGKLLDDQVESLCRRATGLCNKKQTDDIDQAYLFDLYNNLKRLTTRISIMDCGPN